MHASNISPHAILPRYSIFHMLMLNSKSYMLAWQVSIHFGITTAAPSRHDGANAGQVSRYIALSSQTWYNLCISNRSPTCGEVGTVATVTRLSVSCALAGVRTVAHEKKNSGGGGVSQKLENHHTALLKLAL